jgi:hypothetical protein
VDSIVMAIGFAQNVAIRISHGGKNAIVVMRQNLMMEMEITDQDQEIQEEISLEADKIEVKEEISLEVACEEAIGQDQAVVGALIVNVHTKTSRICNLKLFN